MPPEPDQKTQETSPPSEPRTRQIPGVPVGPPSSESEVDQEAHEALQMKVAMKMVGSAMVFVGFIQVSLSLNTGAEINFFPIILYFSGLALWAHSSVKHVFVRYVVIGLSIFIVCILVFCQLVETNLATRHNIFIVCILVFCQQGVLFWHKYVIYWGTIAMVVYFMFQNPKKPSNSQ